MNSKYKLYIGQESLKDWRCYSVDFLSDSQYSLKFIKIDVLNKANVGEIYRGFTFFLDNWPHIRR